MKFGILLSHIHHSHQFWAQPPQPFPSYWIIHHVLQTAGLMSECVDRHTYGNRKTTMTHFPEAECKCDKTWDPKASFLIDLSNICHLVVRYSNIEIGELICTLHDQHSRKLPFHSLVDHNVRCPCTCIMHMKRKLYAEYQTFQYRIYCINARKRAARFQPGQCQTGGWAKYWDMIHIVLRHIWQWPLDQTGGCMLMRGGRLLSGRTRADTHVLANISAIRPPGDFIQGSIMKEYFFRRRRAMAPVIDLYLCDATSKYAVN